MPHEKNALHEGILVHHGFICLILGDCFQVPSRGFVRHQVGRQGALKSRQTSSERSYRLSVKASSSFRQSMVTMERSVSQVLTQLVSIS